MFAMITSPGRWVALCTVLAAFWAPVVRADGPVNGQDNAQSILEQAQAARQAGKLGQAYTLFMSASQSLSGDDAKTARDAADALARDAREKLRQADEAVGAGNGHLAINLLEPIRQAYEGSPMGDEAAGRLKDIEHGSVGAVAATAPSGPAPGESAGVGERAEDPAKLVAQVKARVLATLYATAEYKADDAQMRAAYEKLAAARQRQDDQGRLDASAEYNRARAKVEGLVAAALQDPELKAAQRTQRQATQAAAPATVAPGPKPAARPEEQPGDMFGVKHAKAAAKAAKPPQLRYSLWKVEWRPGSIGNKKRWFIADGTTVDDEGRRGTWRLDGDKIVINFGPGDVVAFPMSSDGSQYFGADSRATRVGTDEDGVEPPPK